MKNQVKLCQSCGMPLDKDPNNGGTNADKSKSNMYCSYCYKDGKFLDEGISLQEKIEKNVQIAVKRMNIPENEARRMAENLLPKLERWKS
ncbi:MAG: zinc ribbon domain-containing protein [Bacteroidales bacterium]|nr:zinc ribbon domain-containing protein [Bacteroidales bacterium]HPD95696.1 zinc ribbon domain-containing protein [Tenuifilaceae bacterium]